MSESVEARFLAKVRIEAGHWLWTAALDHDGYGRFGYCGKARKAHRIAWFLYRGPIPDEYEIDHVCRMRACVNPDHLELVVHKTNVHRGLAPAAHNLRKVACPEGHPYDYVEASSGRRRCRRCRRQQRKSVV